MLAPVEGHIRFRPPLPGRLGSSDRLGRYLTLPFAGFCKIYQGCTLVPHFLSFCRVLQNFNTLFFCVFAHHLQSPFGKLFKIYVARSPLASPVGRLGLLRPFLSCDVA